MKILVTGATGFLGHHIAKDLLALGHEVINFSRGQTQELKDLGIETRNGDLTKAKDVASALKGIDAVFHVAGKVGMWGRKKDFELINIQGTRNIVDEMRKANIKYLVYTSTPSVVFGKEEIKNGNEKLPYPKYFLNDYARTKSIAEDYVLKANDEKLMTTAIRPHLIYGERDKNIIPTLVSRASSGRLKIIGSGNNLVDINYVENASLAHIRAFNELTNEAKNQGKAYFIGQERAVNLWQFINQILEGQGISPLRKKVPLNFVYFIGAICEFIYRVLGKYETAPPMTRFIALQMGTSHYFSHNNAQKDFGHTPKITIEESLVKIKNHRT